MTSLPRLTLVLGGARSGKSRYAEGLVAASGGGTYLATAEALDEEMRARIEEHRQRRASTWTTLEEPIDLAGALARADARRPLLIDCLTLWLGNVMLAGRNVDADCDALIAALGRRAAPVVAVSNEVGLGIVPDNALARAFRDAQGTLNQRVAQLADRVVLLTAGLPLVLKG
ncbi:MAG: bifunctional adenosylcobinamide kinase/adenosylcobinamide-phosphate guanylyltransferase [Alphaproteobacteria bacterium]|nr:bifunctional adenosylcobinamide kinase/adenosylcobinamide-phosphate guanylyltransferase [Alphaproteobacteria bacterium]